MNDILNFIRSQGVITRRMDTLRVLNELEAANMISVQYHNKLTGQTATEAEFLNARYDQINLTIHTLKERKPIASPPFTLFACVMWEQLCSWLNSGTCGCDESKT